jgi:hypothetical protein
MTRAALRVSLALGAFAALTAVSGCNDDGSGTNVDAVRGQHGAGASSSSSGSLAARSLINRDGTADFEATTGMLDSASPAPGRLERLDLQMYDSSGALLVAQSYSSGDGYLGSRLPGVRRGDPFRVEAVLTLPGMSSSQSASVQGLSHLRPDLAFDIIGPEHGLGNGGIIGPEHVGIIGPEHATLNNAVHISSRVIEMNHDVGAVADCQLFVDGVLVLVQTDVAVPAGGSADCRLDWTFTSLGVHTVTLTLGNVKPGDWDYSNNSATDTISIIGPEHTH